MDTFDVSLTQTVPLGETEKLRFFIGTYTGQDGGQGIYTSWLDMNTGSLEEPVLAAKCDNPAFLAFHPTQPYLYAIEESRQGILRAFLYDKMNGKLALHDEKKVPGRGPCHLVCCQSEDGETAIVVANYGSGSVVSFPILGNGKIGNVASEIAHVGLGPHPTRQQEPHAHGAYFDGQTVAVPDLGIDQVIYYGIDLKTAQLSPSSETANLQLPAGAGPRRLAVSKDMQYVYVVNELDSTVSVFDRFLPKSSNLIQTVSTLPKDVDAVLLDNSTAEITLHPCGSILYVSNRGHDSIAVFSIDHEKKL